MNQYTLFFLFSLSISTGLLAQDLESKLTELIAYKNSNQEVLLDYNPFVSETKVKELFKDSNNTSIVKDKNEIKLVSIFNQKAFISGKWYGIGDVIDDKKIVKINTNTVEMKQGSKVTILTFGASKDLLKIKDSRK